MPNARVVELAAKAGMALGCEIASETKWDRKVGPEKLAVKLPLAFFYSCCSEAMASAFEWELHCLVGA